ncbi:MAG: hypothetical protein Q8R15_02515 [Candidatus Micrarchaeota archaeon]|nr:hypothetical protein [Candidatus Micrarchaeota archaeon]
MVAKLKISVFQRGKALALLAKGSSVGETVRKLKERYHPNLPLDVVKRTYFPRAGRHSIFSLEGKPRKELLDVFQGWTQNSREQKQRSTKQNKRGTWHGIIRRLARDPEFETMLSSKPQLTTRVRGAFRTLTPLQRHVVCLAFDVNLPHAQEVIEQARTLNQRQRQRVFNSGLRCLKEQLKK